LLHQTCQSDLCAAACIETASVSWLCNLKSAAHGAFVPWSDELELQVTADCMRDTPHSDIHDTHSRARCSNGASCLLRRTTSPRTRCSWRSLALPKMWTRAPTEDGPEQHAAQHVVGSGAKLVLGRGMLSCLEVSAASAWTGWRGKHCEASERGPRSGVAPAVEQWLLLWTHNLLETIQQTI
jgi:hypothetical protein